MRLTLNPDPTFKAKVEIHVPGKGAVPVEFVYRYRDKDESAKLLEAAKEMDDVQSVLAVAEGWDIAETFNEQNVRELLKKYPLAGFSIVSKYFSELIGAREKN